MAISRIKTDGIQDEAVTSAKIGDNIDLDGQFVRVPHGTTAERPGSPAAGYLRFNTDNGTLEQWNTNTNSWAAVDSPPIITSVTGGTALDPAGGETVTVNGSNFKSGAIISVNNVNQTTSFVSTTQVTFVTSATAAGDYDVKLTNPNGLTATSTNAVSFNGLPAFSSPAAGAISGDYIGNVAIPTITIVASEPDGGTIAYSITSGSLPTGVTLGSANGQITGTPTGISATTNFPFTVTATDDESQTSTRNFTLNVLRPVKAYSIDQSLLIEDNQYLYRTPSSSGNRKTFTFSTWIKRNQLCSTNNYQGIFTGTNSNNEGNYTVLRFDNDNLVFKNWSTFYRQTLMKFNDFGAWYHIVVKVDTTAANADDRIKFIINGYELQSDDYLTSGSNYNNPSQNYDFQWGNSVVQAVGTNYFSGGSGHPGYHYFAETHFVDGTALDATSFGETYNGVWVPKGVSGVTYGTTGFHLKYISGGIGIDYSGNSNNFSATASLDSNDISPDSPTQNYCVMNAGLKLRGYNSSSSRAERGMVLSEGGLKLDKGSANGVISYGTIPMNRGKWYWEFQYSNDTTSNRVGLGVSSKGTGSMGNGNGMGSLQDYGLRWEGNLQRIDDGSATTDDSALPGGVPNANEWIGVAFDADTGRLFFRDSTGWGGPSGASYDPATATSSQYMNDVPTEPYHNWLPTVTAGGSYVDRFVGRINFGQDAFQYTQPTGYKKLTAENQAEVLSVDETKNESMRNHYVNLSYTGNASTNAITGVGFKPGFALIFNKTAGQQAPRFIARGMTSNIAFNTNQASYGSTAAYTFDTDGITWTGGSANANDSGANYIAHFFKTNDGITNTQGDITSTTYVNPDAGWSYITYTGASGQSSVGHGLVDKNGNPEKPDWFLVKAENTSAAWLIWSGTFGQSHAPSTNATNSYIVSSGTDAPGSLSAYWGSGITNTVIGLSSAGNLNNNLNGVKMHIWAFKNRPGISYHNVYRGNSEGSEQAGMIPLDFEPGLYFTRKLGSGDAMLFSNGEDFYNGYNNDYDARHELNGTGSGSTTDFYHTTRNGIKMRSANANFNQDNVPILVFAFAGGNLNKKSGTNQYYPASGMEH